MPINRKGRIVAFGVVLALTLGTTFPSATHAQESEECTVSFQDLDQDGQPDMAVIQCPFSGSDGDAVRVYDRAGNMQVTERWETSVDFEDDVWVFDAAGDGTANLVIAFHRDGDELVAELYDDQDDDAEVRYTVTNGVLAVQESAYPTVRVVAPDGWWLQDATINYNLNIEVDGVARASFHSPIGILVQNRPELARGLLNGRVDCLIHVRDTDYDGRPDHDIRQVYPPPPFPDYYGTELTVNTQHNEICFTDFAFWPHLGTYTGYIKPYAGSVPPIQIDWGASRIAVVAEFVASRGHDSNWFIYSMAKFGYDDRTFANFENPFAFYDLAADRDGYPELMIRMEYSRSNAPDRQFRQPMQMIRFSWDQDNNQSLDYKLGLYGRHEIIQLVTFPDFAVRTVPYPEYPDWVIGRNWDAAFFVAVEAGRYWSTEGIYEGSDREWRDSYITGLTNEPSLARTQDTRQGLRLEYTPQLLQQAWLYFSPIDCKLHLRHAWGGVWNIDDVQRVRFEDLDGDGYLDQWTLTVGSEEIEDSEEGEEEQQAPEQLVKSLQVVEGFLVYGDKQRAKLIHSQTSPSLFETLPPRNHAEWLALGKQLDRHRQDFAPHDFLGMMGQFRGPTTEIEGSSLEDFRLTEDGFRFVLNLQPGFRVVSDENAVDVAHLADGVYLVTYDGVFRAQALTPPHITGEISCEPPVPQQMAWVTIQAVLHNDGLRDVQSLPVRLYAAREGGEPFLLKETQVAVPGGGDHARVYDWPPREPGRWTVWVEADAAEAVPAGVQLGSVVSLGVEVQPAPMPDMFRPTGRYDGVGLTWPVALLLARAGLAAISVLGMIWIRATDTTVVEPTSEES